MSEDFLDERVRAEDIILGSCGFGEDAELLTLEVSTSSLVIHGRWRDDGDEFEHVEELDELDDLQRWAVGVLKQHGIAH